jgi:hypothetical protein
MPTMNSGLQFSFLAPVQVLAVCLSSSIAMWPDAAGV